MKLSDKILVIAKWLEASDNELLVEANDQQLDTLALSLVHAAETLKDAASEISTSEPSETVAMTTEKLEELAAVATAFDESGDELLVRQASVLDEILHTLAAPKDYIFNFKKAEEDKLEVLKKKYREPKKEIDENIGAKEALEALKKSPMYQQEHRLSNSLSARTCFDHPGAQLSRLSDSEYQCSLDHKIYNFETGFTTLKGDKIGGGSVSEQTPKYHQDGHQMFDTRPQRLGTE